MAIKYHGLRKFKSNHYLTDDRNYVCFDSSSWREFLTFFLKSFKENQNISKEIRDSIPDTKYFSDLSFLVENISSLQKNIRNNGWQKQFKVSEEEINLLCMVSAISNQINILPVKSL